MSDTRQRSIAEIIGWERAADYDEERWVDPIDHVAWLPGSGYDCDDMLAWLDANTRQDQQVSMYMRNRGPAEWCVLITNPRSIFAEYRGPTLHAALEAAVRAVAEAGDE